MNGFRFILLAALIMALGCGGGSTTTTRSTAPRSSGSDFAQLCRAVGAEGGKMSREQFLAKSKDKQAAAKLFDACDANRDRMITEEEARQGNIEGMKRQAIRLTSPGSP